MIEKETILGFKKKDAEQYGRTEKTSLLSIYRRIYRIPQSKCVPAVFKKDIEGAIKEKCEACMTKTLPTLKSVKDLEQQLADAEKRDQRDYAFAMEYKNKVQELEKQLAEKEKEIQHWKNEAKGNKDFLELANENYKNTVEQKDKQIAELKEEVRYQKWALKKNIDKEKKKQN